jgi:hypothetical protein
MKLSPADLADIYTLEEINTKITYYMEALEGATVKQYDKDTSQGSQSVESVSMTQIQDVLAIWIKAKQIKTGNGGVKIFSGNYAPKRPNGAFR